MPCNGLMINASSWGVRSPAAHISWREYCSQQIRILYTFVGLSRTYLIQLLLTNDVRPPSGSTAIEI